LVAGTLSVVALAVAAAYVLNLSHPEKSAPVPETLPKNINQTLSGYTFTRSEGGRQIFTVRAARTVAFKDGGRTLLEDVTVEVYGSTARRRDLLKARQCDYQTQTGSLSCLSNVEIELNAGEVVPAGSGLKGRQPLYLETSKVNYEPKKSLATSDEPARFRYGPAAGSAVGVRYDTKDGSVELKKDVVINLTPTGSITLPLRVTSTGLSYDKDTGQVELRGPVEITQANRRVQAGRGKIFLDQQNRITQAILEGGAQGVDTSAGSFLAARAETVKADFDPSSGEMRTLWADGEVEVDSRGGRNGVGESATSINRLSAQHVDISFTCERSRAAQPQSGSASGNVKLTLESRAPTRSGGTSPGATVAATEGRTGSERKELDASEVQFEFSPGGESLKSAKTIGPGELVIIPSDLKQGKRVIRAGQFLMAFGDRNHLERLRGLSHTSVVVEPPADKPSAVPQESWSDELDAKLDTTTQQLVTVEQAGNFRFRDGEREAKADRADYSDQDQMLSLIGRPVLWDSETRIRATQFRVNLRSGTAEGYNGVSSTHFERVRAAPPVTSPPGAQSAQNKVSQNVEATTNVLADRVRAERESQFVRYEGHVRAWNGFDVIESPSLDIYRKQQRVVSGSRVLSIHLQPGPARSGSPAPAGGRPGGDLGGSDPVTIRADRLEYLNEGREASYRGQVEVETGDTTLKGERVDVYFSSLPAGPETPAGAAQVERAVATGHVTVTQPTRRATGEHVEYFAGPGKVVLTGGPPTLYDQQNGFTTGRSLTFFIRDDSLFVDGGDESSTLTKRHLTR
jgi:LPS export ABC transporter protein LptC/lipopolysaccharide transport protein LptA